MFKKLLGVTLLFVLSPAMADGLSYNYLQLGYQRADLDGDFAGISIDGDGYGVGGSLEVGENWFIGVGYNALDFDFGVDLEQLSVGAGYHFGLSDRSDFYATLAYIRAELSASGFGSIDEDGYGVTIGIRGMLSDNVELQGSIAYTDLGDGADGTAFGAGALYNFTETFALGFEVSADDDVTVYGIGARFYFGN